MKTVLALWAVSLALFATQARADRVVTQDGRILAPKKARTEGTGYKLAFENGDIVLPDKSLVRQVEIEGDMSDYVPQNDDEKSKLEQGYVKYRSRWMSAPAYKEELRKEFEASKKRTEEIKAHSDWDHGWTKKTAHAITMPPPVTIPNVRGAQRAVRRSSSRPASNAAAGIIGYRRRD